MTKARIADPHGELGVSPQASLADIRAAYRRLAARWHPDRNAHAHAAGRMQRINQAYRQLCDDDAAVPDAAPAAAPDAAADEPPPRTATAWWEADGSGARWAPDGAAAPTTVRCSAGIGLEQAAFGCVHVLKGSVADLCTACAGTGRLVSRRSACRSCRGEGRLRASKEARWTACTACAGDGAERKRCDACAGSGVERVLRAWHYEVRLPAGLRDGSVVMLRGQGQRGGAAAGDIALRVQVEPHPLFAFDDAQRLVCRLPVDVFRAAGHGTVEVPTLDGAPLTLDLARGPVQVIEGHGFPRRDGSRGPLVVEVRTVVPQAYSAAQRVLLRRLADDLRQGGYVSCDEMAAWQAKVDAWRTALKAPSDDA